MRQLRFLRAGDDPDHAICETADGSEQFVLRIDQPMREALRADLPRLRPDAPEPAAPIGPREIQMRVRAGESPEELAAESDMPLERVMRFAAAVLQERARIADEARRSRARRPDAGTDGALVVFGETVDQRFEAHGIDSAAVKWGSYRRDDGQWIVVAQWMGGDSEREAEWAFHLGTRSVTPLDGAATDLLSDKPVRVLAPEPPPAPAAPPLVPGVVAFPAMPDAHTGKLPKVEDVFDQEAEPARPPSALRPPLDDALLPGFDAPPLPIPGLPKSTVNNLGVGKRGDETDEQKAERARIPSWDDILLGVRRKHD